VANFNTVGQSTAQLLFVQPFSRRFFMGQYYTGEQSWGVTYIKFGERIGQLLSLPPLFRVISDMLLRFYNRCQILHFQSPKNWEETANCLVRVSSSAYRTPPLAESWCGTAVWARRFNTFSRLGPIFSADILPLNSQRWWERPVTYEERHVSHWRC